MRPTSLLRARDGVRIGVHTPLQHATVTDLQRLWAWVDAARAASGAPVFDWISVWDHFGSLTGEPQNLEAVAAHTALACSTSQVACGCLVYSVGYRHPLQLASAIATIDHWSGGRAVLGLGAGYLAPEHLMLGGTMPDAGDRARRLATAARAIRRLLDGHTVSVDQDGVTMTDARCAVPTRQPRVPIVIGGGGERVTIPLAAELADGWNIPMATPEDVAHKVRVLREHESRFGRAPGEVEASVNIGLCFDTADLPARFGPRWEALRPAICTGSDEQVLDLVGRYVEAGADRLLLSLRAPYDQPVMDDLERFASVIAPRLP